jgi:hypothetical protein
MPPLLAVLVIVLAACLPGTLALFLWRKRFSADPIEFDFAALSLGLLLIGWLALLLAEMGRFSLAALAGAWAVSTVALAAAWLLRSRREGFPRRAPVTWDRWEAAGLSVWLVVAAFVYFRPHEFIVGGADAGVYVNLGANIATTGRILIDDPLLGELDPGLRPALLRAMAPGEAAPYYILPGFYVTGDPPGRVTPQFFHLHPAWQAVGYALGGLRAELWVTPLWGILGCLAVYMTVRALWGWQPALLALLALSATALQVWFARYPTAEALTQYLFWIGMWALIRWLEEREDRTAAGAAEAERASSAGAPRSKSSVGVWARPLTWPLLAGAAFGELLLARADTYVLLALPVALAGWLTVTRAWRRDALWFFAPLLLLALHSLLHGWFITRPYLGLVMRTGTLILLGPLLAAVGLGLLAATAFALWLRARPNWRARAADRAARLLPVGQRVAAVALVVIALYAYFVRPASSAIQLNAYWYGGGSLPTLDQENFLRLGWYLSPVGLALGVAGIALLLVRELNRKTAFLAAACGFFAFVFLWHSGTNPHQVYTMRRYVPQVVPFFTVGAVYLLWWIWTRPGSRARWLAGLLTLAWIAGILASGRPFVTQVDYRGLSAQVAELGRALPEKSVVLFSDPSPVGVGDFIGTPLRFLAGKQVFVIRDTAAPNPHLLLAAVQHWQEQGYRVYWAATDGAALPPSAGWPGAALPPGQSYQIETEMLEGLYDRKPSAVVPVTWRFTITEIPPIAPS